MGKPDTEAAETLRLIRLMAPFLRPHVIPIIDLDERERPSVWGTALVVAHRGRIFLATAGHVLSPLREKRKLHAYVAKGQLREIGGAMTGSAGPGAAIDLAVLLPPDGALVFSPETGVEPIDSSRLAALDPPHDGRLFLACGYPTTKGRLRLDRGEFRTSMSAHLAMGVPAERVRDLGLSGGHIVVRMNKARVIGLSGHRERAPDPHGMSGAPLFLMVDEAAPERIGAPIVVAGFAIEHRQSDQVLVASNSAFVLIMMDKLIDDLCLENGIEQSSSLT